MVRGRNQDIAAIGFQIDSGEDIIPAGQTWVMLEQQMLAAPSRELFNGIWQSNVFSHQCGQRLLASMSGVNIQRIEPRYSSGRNRKVRLWPPGPPLPDLVRVGRRVL